MKSKFGGDRNKWKHFVYIPVSKQFKEELIKMKGSSTWEEFLREKCMGTIQSKSQIKYEKENLKQPIKQKKDILEIGDIKI